MATGAPISGILFAIEEAHERVTPMLLIVTASAVMFSELANELLSPLLGVSPGLFPKLAMHELEPGELWLPALIGVVVGFFAVAFLKYYGVLRHLFQRTMHRIPQSVRIFMIFALTLGLGLISYSFISTGHHLILSLLEGNVAIPMLLFLLVARSTLTIGANANRITGGIFLPILALGALLSAVLGKAMVTWLGLDPEFYTLILVLGITACIAGMMKMPLTAIVFSVEALSGYGNILPVIIVAAVSFIITEVFSVHSINDTVLESRIEALHEGKYAHEIDTQVVVQPGSFAIGKQIRDVLWPNRLLVLSMHRDETGNVRSNAGGGKEMRVGDVLHVHCTTYDEAETMRELVAIVGEQPTD